MNTSISEHPPHGGALLDYDPIRSVRSIEKVKATKSNRIVEVEIVLCAAALSPEQEERA